MPEEASTTTETKVTSDGSVKISVEAYNDLLKRAATKPPVINRTNVVKTDEMLAKESKLWGGSLMGVGASLFAVGAGLFKSGLK